jgi:pyruvate/2-oxoglutarate dehydrogenase complex dihydrolipoamide dehydrogenase (E3) component
LRSAAQLDARLAPKLNMDTQPFDLVVIGGGPAGSSGAITAGVFGHRVALVEKEAEMGGAGLN